MSGQKLYHRYTCAVIALGTLVLVYSLLLMPVAAIDLRFLLLAAITLGITSHISITIPSFKSEISVSDTFVFLTLLLYGGEAAVLLAAAECFISSRRFCRTKQLVAFNSMVMGLATFFTGCVLRFCFGHLEGLTLSINAQFLSVICLMALAQYVANSGLIGLAASFKTGQPFFRTWQRYYLWTSLTYVAGASTAGIISYLMQIVGSYAILVATPIVAVVYFTYRTYLKNVEASAAQAAQAERHIEELSHYIAEQERIREQYAQIEKLSALGELASGVAHDFNNTLAGILGRAQLLLRTNDPEKIKRGLQLIIQTAEDGAKTIKRIQDFAHQRRDHDFAPVSVEQLLTDVSEITRPRWKDRAEASGIHITLELQARSQRHVMGDDSELREVLVNIVFNAIDAMPTGGKLMLMAEWRDGEVEISISDTGLGMTPDVRSRIFDPFFTTKGKAGMGLGLAVSYGIVRRHAGTIEVESELGRGTTFRIKLPVAEIDAQTHVVSKAEKFLSAVPHPAHHRARILVVDDENSVRELLQEILECEGHEVVTATDGGAALALFGAEHFDAVFTDIGMQGMSGWELAHAIRAHDSAVRLAVITGWGEAVGSEEQKAADVDWVVTKPFNTDRIIELAHAVATGQARESIALTHAA